MPIQSSVRETKLNKTESDLVDMEIQNLVEKGVLKKAQRVKDEYISTIFLRPKPDGSFRMILNLKGLNKYVEYKHFKMEHLNNAVLSMTPNCFMGSIDLKDAYYTVSIHPDYRKYLRFIWRGEVWEYQCLAFGLSPAPRLFTKLLKPVYATLRGQGHFSVTYIDDSYLQGKTVEECQTNIHDTIHLLTKLGFVINYEKSELQPTQTLKFLGFILDSKKMTIRVTEQKSEKLRQKVSEVISAKFLSIRQVSELLGLMVAYSIAVPYGRLFSLSLEREKINALKYNKGNFDSLMTISESTVRDIMWWHDNINIVSAPVRRAPPEIELYTDASSTIGWGAVLMDTRTGGNWSPHDLTAYNHINQLELFAVLLAIQSFINKLKNKHVKVHIDNITAVACINNFGSTRSDKCNHLARQIWEFAMKHDIWLSVGHISGVKNDSADGESRKLRTETEWMLCRITFQKITEVFFKPDIDLFASRLNNQVDKYISWIPDPGAIMVDALGCSWKQFTNLYIFCPFSLIHRVIQKIMIDCVTAIMIIPDWPTASWYPLVMKLCMEAPRILPRKKSLLTLPQDQTKIHPLYPKLRLLACHVSGNNLRAEAYQRRQFLSL